MPAIEILPFALKLAQEYRWAKGVQTERRGLLVHVEAFGAEGWGEAAPPIHWAIDADALAAETRALVAGLPLEAPDFLVRLDARQPPPHTRCGIAAAWMAARAAAAGQPLAALVGARHASTIPVNGLVTDKTPEDAAARARDLVGQGARTLKVKCGADRPADIARLAAIRAAAPSAALRLDANESWPEAWALDHVRDLARFDISYIEQPIPAACGLDRLAAFRRESPVRTALDESASDIASIRAILAAGAADVIILKTQQAGGPDQAGAVIEACAAAGVQVTVTVSLESAIGTAVALHVASTLPEPRPDCGLAMGRFLAEDLGPMPPIGPGFAMCLPMAGPGLGLAPEPAALAALR